MRMHGSSVVSERSTITSLALGIVLGIIAGFATSFVFLLIIVGPLLGIGLAVAGLRSGPDGRSLANVGGGLLIGTGGVYLLGALNTLNSCQGQDVCGGASAVPFLGFAVVVLVLGLLVERIAFARYRWDIERH